MLQVTVCTLGFSSRLYLQRWTGFGATSHCLYPWFVLYVILTEVDRIWCYKLLSVPFVCALCYTYRGGQNLVLQVTICTLGSCSMLYLQRWTGIGVTSHCLYPWFMLYVILTDVDRVWCYKSPSVPLVPALCYTYRGRQGLMLQVTVCTLGSCSMLYLQRWTGFGVTSHPLYPWFLH